MHLAVSCNNITKSYKTESTVTQALSGITLDIYQGELLMLVGPSGCGKTTLISIIAGILNSDEGECNLFGTSISNLSDRAKTRYRGKNIGFVFQSFNLIPTLNIVENTSIPLILNKHSSSYSKTKAREILSRVGLEDKFKCKPNELSGGQQQRVAIARSLVHDPKLIVCDEPTSALDQENGHKIMEIFREVALSDNRTIIIVTHDSRILSFSDRIARMNDGKIQSVEVSKK